jgi:hypothetical protein
MALPATPPESWADNSPKLGLFNQGNTIIVKMRKYIEHRHAKVFQNFSQTQSDLVTQLSNTNSFILPAGGTFFYCNPVLNYDGALLCNIFYNDNEGSAAKPNPNAPARKVVVVTPVLAPVAGRARWLLMGRAVVRLLLGGTRRSETD